jgi:hypothetical protein
VSEARIDFLLGPGLISRGIAYFGQGGQGWSHCASMLKDGRYLDARDNKINGVPPGVHIRAASTEVWVKKRTATLALSDADYALWEHGLRNQLTTQYDQHAILGFLEGKSMHSAGHWICSALAANGVQHMCRSWTSASFAGEAYQRLGFVPFPLPNPAHQISPDALLLILATAGWEIGPIELPPGK